VCQFRFIVTWAFLRSLEAHGDDEGISQLQEGYRYHLMQAEILFSEEFNSAWNSDGSNNIELGKRHMIEGFLLSTYSRG
jgi:hypothetical protein